MTRDEAEIRLAAFAPMLADRFPADAFTSASLEHVAAECVKGFPTYGELVQHLGAWWHDNRPQPPRIAPPPPAPERPPPTQDEIDYVHARVQEMLRALAPTHYADQVYRPKPRYLTPAQLDQLNPLPNRKRTDAQQATVPVSEAGNAAAVDSGAAENMATAGAGDGEPGAP